MIEFREDTHEYFLDGRKLISVTQLMRKHGLAPSYDAVPSEILRAKAERGTLIHKEIENYIKRREFGFTNELENFVSHIKKHDVTPLASEFIVHNDVVAGTVDMISEELGEVVINDFKTTATLHKEAVSWQLSIYAYLNETGHCATKAKAYHFQPDGTLKVVDIPFKPMAEVERLLECERNGEIYTQSVAVVVNETALAELVEVESLIKSIEEQKKVAEAQAVELRAALMQAMEQNGVTSFENENIKVTYVAATTRTAIDSAKLKKELPEIAEKYAKTSNVKASLRITLKEDK